MDIHRLLERRNGIVKMFGFQPRVETLVFMTGVQKIMHFYDDEAAALAGFDAPPKQSGDVRAAS